MKTAMQELLEKCIKTSENNQKYNSQFHKGLCHAFDMVSEAIEQLLLEKERQQIEEAFMSGCYQVLKFSGEISASDYYTKTYNNGSE